MSYQGVPVSTEGQQHVPSAIGPMARSLSSLTTVTKAVIESEPWSSDPLCPPLPWRENIFQESSRRSLVIGTMLDDGVVKVHPPIERVFRDMVGKLQAAGHETVEWDTRLNVECIGIMVWHFPIVSKRYPLKGNRTSTTPPTVAKTSEKQ